jgi:hypothetical protein
MKKGHTNNPNGRPKGSTNKITREIRKTLKDVVDIELNRLPGLLQKLETQSRLELLVKLLPYVLPKIEAQPATKDEPLDMDIDFL